MADTTAPLVILAAGGTGGHMFPAQALAEALLVRGWRVVLTTDARGARHAGGFPPDVAVKVAQSASFARGGALARALVVPRIAAGTLATLVWMRRARPAAVAGFGGYPAIPALAAARLLRIPALIHEQNARPGRVNRLFARHAARVAAGLPLSGLPQEVAPVLTGNPVRAAVRARAGAGYIPPGDYPMSLVVIGGSQGARVLADTVPEAVARLPEAVRRRLRVAQQARPEDADRVLGAYTAAGIEAEVASFFHDIPRRLSEAQLVISRAGASSLADLAVIGRPAILIPYAAAADDHQSANAATLAETGGAVALPESGLDAGTLSGHIAAILGDPARAEAMAAAVLATARPEAAEALADLVEEIAGRKAGA